MGKRGRLPMPPHLRLLKGDGRPSRARQPVAAEIPATKPEPPSWLPEQACAEWRSVSGELFRLGLLTTLDTAPLAAWAVAAARFKAASEALQAMPESERLISKGKVNPLVKIVRNAADEMHTRAYFLH